MCSPDTKSFEELAPEPRRTPNQDAWYRPPEPCIPSQEDKLIREDLHIYNLQNVMKKANHPGYQQGRCLSLASSGSYGPSLQKTSSIKRLSSTKTLRSLSTGFQPSQQHYLTLLPSQVPPPPPHSEPSNSK